MSTKSKPTHAILLGYSGHGYVVAEAALQKGMNLLGYAEARENDTNPYELPYLGDETATDFNWETCPYYVLGVGSNTVRAKIARRVIDKGGQCLTIIHPHACISKKVNMGAGTFIARNVAVNPMTQIGENVILNTSCSIDHECKIGNHAHIAPGAVLAGNVKVGEGAFIGANAVVKEGVTVGAFAVIGAGSVVVQDVLKNVVAMGNPAKPMRK